MPVTMANRCLVLVEQTIDAIVGVFLPPCFKGRCHMTFFWSEKPGHFRKFRNCSQDFSGKKRMYVQPS